MCGIYFSCSQQEHRPPSNALIDSLRRRGPDGVDTVSPSVTLETTVSRISGSKMRTYFPTFLSTVLSLRGSSVVIQPLRDPKSSSLLCWNGEAWKIGKHFVQGNDAEYVFEVFLNAIIKHSHDADDMLASPNQGLQGILGMLSSITGPYAFVFYDAQHHRVFYGRDALGRRSLLIRRYSTTSIALSSICDPTESEHWMEVEADGVHVFDFTADVDLSNGVDLVTHVPWAVDHSNSSLTPTLVPHTLLLLRTPKTD